MSDLIVIMEIALLVVGVFIWVMIFRHLKFLHTIYGGKYVLMLLTAATSYAVISNGEFVVNIQNFFIFTFACWTALLLIKGVFLLVKSPNFQRGFRNYNNLGALNDKWAPSEKKKSQLIGGAPGPKSIQRKIKKSSSTEPDTLSAGKQPKNSSDQESSAKQSESKSATPFSKNHTVCATCDMWGGKREPQPSRVVVHVRSAGERGQCMGGGHNRAQVPATGHCSQYKKWAILN